MLTILEQIEALNKFRPQAMSSAKIHTERRARILLVLKTPRDIREIARLLAITIAAAQSYVAELKDEGLVTEDNTKWKLL